MYLSGQTGRSYWTTSFAVVSIQPAANNGPECKGHSHNINILLKLRNKRVEERQKRKNEFPYILLSGIFILCIYMYEHFVPSVQSIFRFKMIHRHIIHLKTCIYQYSILYSVHLITVSHNVSISCGKAQCLNFLRSSALLHLLWSKGRAVYSRQPPK